MKVCYVTPPDLPIPPVRGGSVQIYVNTLLACIQSKNTISTMLISPSQQVPDQVPVVSSGGHTHHILAEKDKAIYETKALQLVKELQPDIVQVENRPKLARRIKEELGLPTIVHLYSSTFIGSRHIPPQQVRQYLEPLDAVVLISEYLKNTVLTQFGLSGSRWNPAVIYPGIDTEAFPFQARTKTSFSHTRPLRILFVGRVIRQKGVQQLVDAVKALATAKDPVQLTIVGKTHPWEQKYYNGVKASAKGYPVTFAGFVPPAGLHPYYAVHDVFVCPSQYGEAFGLVNLEALSSGLPVIGSKVGGIQEILTEDCGILIDNPKNPESFRVAISHLLHNPQRVISMSLSAKKRAEQFKWNRTADAFINLYARLAEHPLR